MLKVTHTYDSTSRPGRQYAVWSDPHYDYRISAYDDVSIVIRVYRAGGVYEIGKIVEHKPGPDARQFHLWYGLRDLLNGRCHSAAQKALYLLGDAVCE